MSGVLYFVGYLFGFASGLVIGLSWKQVCSDCRLRAELKKSGAFRKDENADLNAVLRQIANKPAPDPVSLATPERAAEDPRFQEYLKRGT